MSQAASALEQRRAQRAAVFLTVTGVLVGVGNLAFNVVVARVSGAAVYGGLSALLGLATIGGFVATGIQYAVARRAAVGSARGLVRGAPFGGVLPWLVVAVCMAAASGPIAGYLRLPGVVPVLLASALFASMVAAAVPNGLAIGRRRFAALAMANVFSVILRIAGVLTLARLLDASSGPLLASILAVVVTAVALLAMVSRQPAPSDAASRPAAGREGGMAAEGTLGAVYAAALWATWSLPVAFARHDLDARRAGAFAAAQVLSAGILFLTAPLVQAVFPTIARHSARGLIWRGLVATLSLGMLGTAALWLGGNVLVHHLYGPGFDRRPVLFVVMGLSATVMSCATYVLWVSRALRGRASILGIGVLVALAFEVVLGNLLTGSELLLAAGPTVATVVGAMAAALALYLRGRTAVAPAGPLEAAGGLDGG